MFLFNQQMIIQVEFNEINNLKFMDPFFDKMKIKTSQMILSHASCLCIYYVSKIMNYELNLIIKIKKNIHEHVMLSS